MSRFPRNTAALLVLATLSVAIAGCKPGEKAEADAPATTAAADAADDGLKIEGLATEKEQVSYMIGLDLAKSLEPVKDELDLDTMNKAMKSGLAGEKSLMTEEQATQVREAFGQKIQAKRIAEMMAAAKKNLDTGKAFLAGNAKKPNVVTTASGLQYQVIEQGTGPKPTAADTVRVHYAGTLLDGKTFDSSYERKEPVVFALQQVVPGWQEGIALMPVGSKYRFWIPSELGYGEQGTPGGPIGPNETLVFEVELQDIVKDAAK
jgi:FKBP-type peptidyl-prolyl cis-trans isomerase